MRIVRTDLIVGLPAADARDVARLFRQPRPESLLASLPLRDGRSCVDIAQAFSAAGYLVADHVDADGETWWITTTAGNALAQASFRPPVSRRTADRNLAALLTRAQTYNDDPSHLLTITELVVFGSYLNPEATELGDLDIGVSFDRREPLASADQDGFSVITQAYARASGRQFSTFVDMLLWPEQELMQTLRHRSPTISLTSENVRELTDRWKVVYSA